MTLPKKIWLLLNYKQKKHAIFMFVLMLVAMVLESLSVGIVFPIISILLKGEIGTSIFSYFFVFGEPTGKNLIYIGLSATFIIFLIKNLTLTFNLWQQTKFLQKTLVELTNKLFKYYLKSDYMFFLQTNSSHLYRNLTSIIGIFISYINKYMILLSEIIVFTGIAFILFYVKPENQVKVKEALSGLTYVPFKFENTGSKIMHANSFPCSVTRSSIAEILL